MDFGSLRAHCHRRGRASFDAIVAWIERSQAQSPGLYESKWSSYVSQSIASWPAHLKHMEVSAEQLGALVQRPAPWAKLVASIRLSGADFSDADYVAHLEEALSSVFSGVQELVFSGPHSRTKEFESLFEAGLFGRITSLRFEDYALHSAAIKLITKQILPQHPEITSLGLVRCDITDSKLKDLADAESIGQIKRLDLSGNIKFEQRTTNTLAYYAERFSSLTHLILEDVTPRQKGLGLLLDAAWPAGLKVLKLSSERLGEGQLKVIMKRGKLGLVFPEQENLHVVIGRQYTQSAFDLLSEVGFWERVTHLEFEGDMVQDFSALADPALELKHVRIWRQPQWNVHEPRWETLEAMCRSSSLESLEIEGMVPDESWWRRVLARRGEALKRVQTSWRMSEEFVTWLMSEDMFEDVALSGFYYIMECDTEETQKMVQRATYNATNEERARAQLGTSYPLLWKLWDHPALEVVSSKRHDPAHSIRFGIVQRE